jgi:hypothetical protein
MIAPHLIEQVQQLLIEGKFSHRKIERITGVSRGTIGAIAAGKRCIRPRSAGFWEDEPVVPDVPPQRCPDCGGMVYMPCRLCRTQKAMAASAMLRALVKTRARQPVVLLGLNLKPVHRERYEEVRRWRRKFSRSNNSTVAPGVAVQMTPQQMHGTG